MGLIGLRAVASVLGAIVPSISNKYHEHNCNCDSFEQNDDLAQAYLWFALVERARGVNQPTSWLVFFAVCKYRSQVPATRSAVYLITDTQMLFMRGASPA